MTSETENKSILRQCMPFEKFYLNHPDSDKNLLFCISIETEINLNERLDIVDKAIYEWKLMHPFLRCHGLNRIVESNLETYYVNADELKIKNSFTNVKILNLDNSRIDKDQDELFNKTWQLVAEKELMSPIDCFIGNLLWRLTFLSFKDNQKSKESEIDSNKTFKFCVLFIANHSICDGRSTYSSLIHLFQIMEDIYKDNYKRRDPYKVFPGKDFYSKDFISEFQCDYFKIPKIEIPSFYNKNPNSLIEFDTNLEYFKEILDEKIFFNNGEDYSTLKDLIENSKINFSKFTTFSYSENKSKSFLQKCKKNNVKVNTCLKTVFSFAMKRLHSKFGSNLETVVFLQPLDVRHHFINKYGPDDFQTLSLFTSAFLNKFDKNLNADTFLSQKWIENFWSIVKTDDEIFQNMMKNQEFLKIPNIDLNMRPDEMWVHFNLTNYGVLPSKTEKSTFNIKEFNVLLAFISKSNVTLPFVIFANTIQSNLFFTLRYNAALINSNIIEFYIQCVDDIFNKCLE